MHIRPGICPSIEALVTLFGVVLLSACAPPRTAPGPEPRTPSGLSANNRAGGEPSIEDLVGRCPHILGPKETCVHLKEQAILFCRERKANPCMETVAQFGALKCAPNSGPEMVVEILEYACGLDSWRACTWLATELWKKGDSASLKRSWDLDSKACSHKYAEACGDMARSMAWWNGKGLPQPADLKEALKWAKMACDLGDMKSCNDYAALLIQRNDPSDKADAKALLESQCASDFELSCASLGKAENTGVFGTPNLKRAKDLWRKACACGSPDGCASMAGRLFDDGDTNAAMRLADYACENRHPLSCVGLAKLYSEGRTVGRDMTRARQYFDRACRLNDWDSCEALKTLDKSRQ
jgi:hypothetical protein